MRKFILTVAAVGAMAVSGAASAQGLFGGPRIIEPAVVAPQGSYPAGSVYTDQYGRQVHVDQYGRHVLIDRSSMAGRSVYDESFGRTVPLDQFGTYVDANGIRWQFDNTGKRTRLDQYGSYRDPYGRIIILGADRAPLYVDQNGQLMAYSSVYGGQMAYGGRADDRDGDGVANWQDRYPDDSRFW